MANIRLPSVTLQLVSTPRREARALSRLPILRQGFRIDCSRAVHFPITRCRIRMSKGLLGDGAALGKARVFGTSTRRSLDGKGENDIRRDSQKRESVGSTNKSATPLKDRLNPTALRETLKSKVSALSHENIYTIPNILTFSRLAATPVIGYLIVTNQHLYAFSLFVYAGFSDLLDGWIARKWNLQTVVGSVVDPMADKALMTTLVGCLAVNGALPLPLATLILGRDVSLAVAAIYYRYASLPAPKTFARYWDFSLPSAEVHPTTISKLNTFLQLGLIGTTMCVGLLHDPTAINSVAGGYLQSIQSTLGGPDGVDMLVKSMSGIVATTTIYSGLSYVWLKDAVKILGEDEELKKKQGRRGRMIIGSCYGAFIAGAGWLAWREWSRKVEDEEK